MRPYAQQFIKLVKEYRLDDRDKKIRQLATMVERGLLGESEIKIYIRRIQPEIEKQKRCFNPLAMAPSADELPEYDIEVGSLVENPDVRIGIRFMDRPRHVLISGSTGSGKTNLLRVIIHGLDRIKKALDNS